ncbi:MFS polyamine transporter [Dichomitus squalens]|nr:MFS polyamine transporter [Dichomitus squalens]
MVAPAAQQIASGFHIIDQFQVNLTISIFVLAYAFGPLFLGPLCEIFGRTRVLRACNLFFFAWNLACGFAQSEGQLIAFRFLAGIGGSSPLAVGGAVLGDMWTPEERGQSIAIYSLAPLLGPVVGPIAGGWIAERSTWRWVFWSTSIAAFVIQIVGLWTLQETYAPILLARKAKKIRAKLDAEGGSAGKEVRTVFQKTAKRDYKQFMFVSLCRPFILTAQEPIIILLGAYLAFVYGVIYLVLTTIPLIYTDIYHENSGIFGLQYISLGVGLTIASQFNARLLDVVYMRLKTKNSGVGEPEFRLPCVFPGMLLLPIGLLIAGWGAQERTHWIVPDIGFAIVGAGIILTFQGMQMYIIDAFAQYAASALAATSFLRSVAGFGFPLFAPAMFKALGYGVGNTILAAIAFAIGCPAIWLFWVYGKKIRETSKHAKSN